MNRTKYNSPLAASASINQPDKKAKRQMLIIMASALVIIFLASSFVLVEMLPSPAAHTDSMTVGVDSAMVVHYPPRPSRTMATNKIEAESDNKNPQHLRHHHMRLGRDKNEKPDSRSEPQTNNIAVENHSEGAIQTTQKLIGSKSASQPNNVTAGHIQEGDLPANNKLESSVSSHPTQQLRHHYNLSPINVAFGLSGNHSGFLSEFEVALKSLLLNAPLERTLAIHILADQDAILALTGNPKPPAYRPPIFELIELPKWISRSPIEIHIYDVSPEIPALTKQVDDTYTKFYDFQPGSVMLGEATPHTIGAYFRLFADRFLPPTVHNLLYIDVDVVIMTNLEELWKEVETNPDALFHWGNDMCSGFVVMNVPRMNEIWALAQKSPVRHIAEKLNQSIGDQLLVRSVNITYPKEVHILSDAWDMSVAAKWQPNLQYYIQMKYPNVGMLHFNGGGRSKAAHFDKKGGDFMNDYPETWGNAKYYVTLPWTWARYQAKGLRQPGSDGYLIRISLEPGRNKNH